MEWFNYYGLAIIIVLMIPNVIYMKKHKDSMVLNYENKFLDIVEKIGRFGCIFCMVANFPYWDFMFHHGKYVYLFGNLAFCLAYIIFWIVCWKQNGRLRALSLSILPTVIFLFSGIMLVYIPLIVFAVVFGATHIFLSWKKAVIKH